jgi:hypothetical protein
MSEVPGCVQFLEAPAAEFSVQFLCVVNFDMAAVALAALGGGLCAHGAHIGSG